MRCYLIFIQLKTLKMGQFYSDVLNAGFSNKNDELGPLSTLYYLTLILIIIKLKTRIYISIWAKNIVQN